MSRPRLEERKAVDIAYIEHSGPYDQTPWEEYIERLYSWAKEQRVMPGFHPMGMYLDDPKAIAPEECRSRIAITFKGQARAKGDVRTGSLPHMKVATLSHRGPTSDIASSYDRLADFAKEKGLTVTGPSMEVYSRKPEVVEGQVVLMAKLMMPVE